MWRLLSAIHGSHIVNPTNQAKNYPRSRVWVCAASAALADAFSTAALLVSDLGTFDKKALVLDFFIESADGIVVQSANQ